MSTTTLKAVDKIEIQNLQDNYIEMTAMDNNAIISRAAPLIAEKSVPLYSRNTAFQPL